MWWGEGKIDGSFYPMFDHEGGTDWTISVWTYGRVEINFQQLYRQHIYAKQHPFASEAKRLELLRRLNEVPGVSIPVSAITRRPTFPLSALVEPDALCRFLSVLDWLVAELRDGSATN